MQGLCENIVEKLEEVHERYINQYGAVGGNPMAFSVKECMEIVKQEAEQYNNGWIPCSSGVMPRANGWYLVTNYLGVVQEQRWSANHWEKLRDEAVLAWRELPLPYQPNGE